MTRSMPRGNNLLNAWHPKSSKNARRPPTLRSPIAFRRTQRVLDAGEISITRNPPVVSQRDDGNGKEAGARGEGFTSASFLSGGGPGDGIANRHGRVLAISSDRCRWLSPRVSGLRALIPEKTRARFGPKNMKDMRLWAEIPSEVFRFFRPSSSRRRRCCCYCQAQRNIHFDA